MVRVSATVGLNEEGRGRKEVMARGREEEDAGKRVSANGHLSTKFWFVAECERATTPQTRTHTRAVEGSPSPTPSMSENGE